MATADETNVALKRADRVEDTLRVLAEFGTFIDETNEKQILTSVTQARNLAAEGKVTDAREAATTGELLLNRLLFARGRVWRSVFLHQLPLFIYHILFLLIFLNIATGWLSIVSTEVWGSVPVPMATAIAGGLGAVLRGLWFLWLKVSRREFRIHFMLAQLSAPWIGMLLGLFAFLLLKAGLLLIEGGTPAVDKLSASTLAICFLAGYNWERFLQWVDSIARRTDANGRPISTSANGPVSPPAPGSATVPNAPPASGALPSPGAPPSPGALPSPAAPSAPGASPAP